MDGNLMKGWLRTSGDCYYFHEDTGAAHTGWLDDGGKRYYFDECGVMLKGLNDIDGHRYCFDDDGAMLKGLQVANGHIYFFNETTGVAFEGWMDYNGARYYFDKGGAARQGFGTINGYYYYFNSECKMQTGWQSVVDGDKVSDYEGRYCGKDRYGHYFFADGKMAVGTYKVTIPDTLGVESDEILHFAEASAKYPGLIYDQDDWRAAWQGPMFTIDSPAAAQMESQRAKNNNL